VTTMRRASTALILLGLIAIGFGVWPLLGGRPGKFSAGAEEIEVPGLTVGEVRLVTFPLSNGTGRPVRVLGVEEC